MLSLLHHDGDSQKEIEEAFRVFDQKDNGKHRHFLVYIQNFQKIHDSLHESAQMTGYVGGHVDNHGGDVQSCSRAGSFSCSDLRNFLKQFGEKMSDEELDEFIAFADTETKGEVNWHGKKSKKYYKNLK